ncbi:MAG: transcription-repair coupling factor [Paludibacteraceae bacterium]|nr:transcription-repair coupling factor [Paludibacteraceae bacterium]
MDINDLLSRFSSHPQFKEVEKWSIGEKKSLTIKGLEGSLCAILFAHIGQIKGKKIFITMDDEESAAYLYHDLTQIIGEDNVFFYPASIRKNNNQKDAANEVLRTEALNRINSGEKFIMVSFPEAIAERVVDKAELNKKTLNLAVGQNIDTDFIIQVLCEYGFSRVDFVYEPGQFSVRGSIIDVFSFSCEYPYRVDFFGDEIESIRTFNIENQLSLEKKDNISIVSNIHENNESAVSLISLLSKDTLLCYNDYRYTFDRISAYTEEIGGAEAFIDSALFFEESVSLKRLVFGGHDLGEDSDHIHFESSPQPVFNKNFDLVSADFRSKKNKGYEVFVLSDNLHQTDRLANIFEDRGDKITFTPIRKTLHRGFIDHSMNLCCYTDHQIFDRYHKYSLRSDKARSGQLSLTLKELQDFKPGDYVVHIDHGVGRFAGLIQVDSNGKKQEVIKLLYQNDDMLLVSIHSLHKISRYKSKEGDEPRINKLGTGAWQTIKERTKKHVKDIARDLIALYAKRREEKGFAYSKDSFLQSELEASFIYEDTPDQIKTTADVKRDMERDMPMDRLVCGDVGFGKTEIAVRAAFKATTDNKQVAILVPTTVLALQHYKTFSERLKDFPVKVDYLNRSRSLKETKRIVKELADGEINILIGTQKILGKEVKFKDLGLLIIDEEQKFGVSTKEKIKQVKVNVDTLTMTATPIPRTLQFSLMGARDLSVITTPPPNRYPIQTELHTFSEKVIQEAIQYELDRNGQVFFINNRVQNLGEIANLIKRLVPEARVAIGHGQMKGEDLEKVILDFLDYEYDVLLATTIVESGIDISNCNTIIVNEAQNFGLSDLHQLRGRVGRSNRRAFCYLLAPPLTNLTTEARRRLQAIESFSELGSGFNIAMQDLDIRGAGNLLGAEQSGFIADLGYEAYQKVLNEAVTELKANEFADLYAEEEKEKNNDQKFVTDCQIETDMELTFPSEYIESVSERMSLYRELDNVKDEKELDAFAERLKDRFGEIPTQTSDLLQLVKLRWIAVSLGFERLTLKMNRMTGYFILDDDSPYYQTEAFGRILTYLQEHAVRCKIRETGGRRSIQFLDVNNVTEAYNILSKI